MEINIVKVATKSKETMLKTNNFGTRNASSESNKCNGIDSVFEIDEAAKMSSNIANDGGTAPDEYERNDESNIAIGHSCKKMNDR